MHVVSTLPEQLCKCTFFFVKLSLGSNCVIHNAEVMGTAVLALFCPLMSIVNHEIGLSDLQKGYDLDWELCVYMR